MRIQNIARILFYSGVAIAAAAGATLGVSIYLHGIRVPDSLLHSRAAQSLALRYGVRYSLESLQIGCLSRNCPGEVNAGALDIEFQIPEPLRVHLNETHSSRGNPLTASGLEVRSGNRPPLIGVDTFQADLPANRVDASGLHIGSLSTVGSVEFDGSSKRVTARGLRFSSTSADSIQLTGWAPTPDNYVALSLLEINGVSSTLPESTASNTICARLPSGTDLGGDALVPLRPLLPLLLNDIQLLHADLLRVAIAIAIVILILKLLSVLWIWRSPLFLMLPIIPAALPFALYFWFRQTFLAGALIMAAIAILLRIFVYRRGEHWYNRWEPFVVDMASVIVMLPLLGYAVELPPLPETPAGIQLERIDVADIALRSADSAQVNIPKTTIRDVRVGLPGVSPDLEVEIASVQIPKTTIAAPPSTRITLDDMSIDDVSAVYDPNRREVGGIAAHLAVGGLLDSDALSRELRNIEFLRGVNTRSRVGFDADVRVSGPQSPPRVSTQFPNSKKLIAVNAAVTLKPVECTASFDVATRILAPSLMMTARADGNTGSIRIRSMRSIPGSPIQIAGGNGNLRLSGAPRLNLDFESIGGSFGSTRLDMDSLGITASAPRPGKAGIQSATFAVGPVSVRPISGWNIRVGRSNIHLDRMSDRRSVPVTFETRIENVQLESPDKLIEANVPLLVTKVSGQATPETIPRRFTGTVDFVASGSTPSDELIGTSKPISFNADFWAGIFNIPEQEIRFRETMLSESRTEIPILFKLAGRLSTITPHPNADIETKIVLSHFDQALGSATIVLDDAHVSGRANWDDQGSTANLNFGIGSTRVSLAPGPSALCLDEISTLDLSASGTISKMPESSGFAAMTQPLSPCASLPSLPGVIQFQISGDYPVRPGESLIRLEREDRTGIRISNIGNEIRSLQIRDGRLMSMETRADISGIGTLQGAGLIDLQADIRQSRDSAQFDSKLLAPDGTLLFEAAVVSTPARIALDATQHVPADRIIAQARPFLTDLKVDLGNVNPQVRLTQLHADANFENGELLSAAVLARLNRGAIASIDYPNLRANVSTSDVGVDPTVSLNLGRATGPNGLRPIVASAVVPGASIHAVADKESVIDVDADLNVIAQGTLYKSGQPPTSPVLEKVFQVSSGLSRQASQLSAVFDSGSAPPTNNLQWKVHLAQNSPSNSLLRFASDSLQMHVADAALEASWASWDGAVSKGRSRISVSAVLDSDIRLEGNEVLVDVLSPVSLAYALDGQAETRIHSNIPIRVAFAERLNRAPAGADSLWNQSYYAEFWRTHPSRFSSSAFASPIDFNEVMLGPLSVREVRFPLEPVRIVVGYADALQVGLPFSGRVLYGQVAGNLESSVAASNGVATLDTRLNLDMKNLQAGAIGSIMSGEHSSIIEDELDGNISLRTDGLIVDRTTLPFLRAGHVNAGELEKIGMSVHLFRTREFASLPGVFQASSDVQINLVNELLNQVVKNLRLPAPPRALTYKDLALDFDVDRGRVRTDSEVFKLGGVQLFSSSVVDATADVRAHLGRPGERIMLGNLLEMLGR